MYLVVVSYKEEYITLIQSHLTSSYEISKREPPCSPNGPTIYHSDRPEDRPVHPFLTFHSHMALILGDASAS